MRRALLLFASLSLVACGDAHDSTPTPTPPPAAPEATPEPAPATEATPADAPAAGGREEHAAALDPATARRVRRLVREGRRASHDGDRATAIERFGQALGLAADGRVLCELGWIQLQDGRAEDARRSLTRGIALLPPDDVVPEDLVSSVGACLYNLGRLEEEAGDVAAARRYYERSLAVRPGNRVVQARLAGLPAASAAGPAPEPFPSCASGESRALDLDAWRARVSALSGPPGRFTAALGEAGLEPVESPAWMDYGGGELEDLTAHATVEVLPLRLGERRGRVVHVTLTAEYDNTADRVSVLVERAPGRFCQAGQLGVDLDACSSSCLGDAFAMRVTTEPLIARDVDALRVVTNAGACACGSFRGAVSHLQLHGVEGDELVEYVDVQTYDAWYESPTPPEVEEVAEVALGASFPKTITVTSRVECAPECDPNDYAARREAIDVEQDEDRARELEDELYDECGDGPPECDDSSETTVYHYADGRYAPTEESAAQRSP